MKRNIELKAQIYDSQKISRIVENLSDSGPTLIEQTDTYFHCREGRLKLRECKGFQAELISYNRPDDVGPKISEYTKVEIENPTLLREALTSTLGIRGVVNKRRTRFMIAQTRIHLDEVDGLGEFLEIEVVLKESQTKAESENIAVEFMEKLGVSKSDLVDCSYIDLIEYRGHLRSHKHL